MFCWVISFPKQNIGNTDSSVCWYECDSHLFPPGLLQYQTERFQWCLCESLLYSFLPACVATQLYKPFQILDIQNKQYYTINPDGAAETAVCPCVATSLLFHCLLHCLVDTHNTLHPHSQCDWMQDATNSAGHCSIWDYCWKVPASV